MAYSIYLILSQESVLVKGAGSVKKRRALIKARQGPAIPW
jgi:hypothetical protein